ncbi:MAG TPA: ABC transporter ATP-binding protein [Planctomycetes bacterium]|nr:ABC transporter ATP-binding protein [Planctomycetota bacterium]
MSIIEINNLSFAYEKSTVLSDLSFKVRQGSFLAIAGPNGAGKSTLLNLLCAVLKLDSGLINIDKQPIESYSTEALAKKIAVVRQEFVPVFGFNVIEMVLMARTPYYGRMGFQTKTDTQIVKNALKATDTEEFASRQLSQISGGERQRVFIARALAQDTPILLLDEPTSFLDLRHQVRVYDLLKKMQLEKGKTIVAITHDINLAAQYCDEVLLLSQDTDYHTGPAADVLSPENLEKVFSVKGFYGLVGKENFFLPLGKFAKDSSEKTS